MLVCRYGDEDALELSRQKVQKGRWSNSEKVKNESLLKIKGLGTDMALAISSLGCLVAFCVHALSKDQRKECLGWLRKLLRAGQPVTQLWRCDQVRSWSRMAGDGSV